MAVAGHLRLTSTIFLIPEFHLQWNSIRGKNVLVSLYLVFPRVLEEYASTAPFPVDPSTRQGRATRGSFPELGPNLED